MIVTVSIKTLITHTNTATDFGSRATTRFKVILQFTFQRCDTNIGGRGGSMSLQMKNLFQ